MKQLFKKIAQSYGNMKLQSKFTLALLLAVTVPILMLGLFFYGRLYNMIVSDTIRQEQDASAHTAPLIEETVKKVVNVSSALTELPFYSSLFHMPVGDSLNELVESADAMEFRQKANELIDGSLITGIRIYTDLPADAQVLYNSEATRNLFSPISSIRGTYWYGIFQGQSTLSELYCPPFYLGTQEQEKNGSLAYIRSTTMYYRQKPCDVYVAVYYSADAFQKILSENLSSTGSVSYIINERNNLVASSDTSLSGIYWLNYDIIKDAFMSSNNFMERTLLDEKVYAGFYSIGKTQWFMVTILPSTPMIEESNRIMFRFALLYLGFLALALVLATFLSRSITGRISSVISQMNLVKQGPPIPMESPSAHDEVGELIDTYNYMTRKMQTLMENQAKSAEDLRIAEFNSLQAQINPHFLYNTMDMINWLAQQGRTSEISSAVQNLSRFYKLTLSRKGSISTIAKEIEHVSIYTQIQNMRFHDSIEFITDIPDTLLDYQIPKLTLQPVVENAILHGILEKSTKSGTIVVTGWMEDSDIVLLVSDDGVGIPPEKMPTILTGTGQSTSGGTNIAVFNTHRRLQILYGSEYGLTYTSEKGKGTEVQIRIPAQTEYHSPYMQRKASDGHLPVYPLVGVSENPKISCAMGSTPEKLLEYSQKLAQNLYSIQNLHQISPRLPQDESIYILSHEVTADFPPHVHSHFELNYVCSGSVINDIDGNEVYMNPGDLIFLNRKAVHSLQYRQPGSLLINFCLKEEAFQGTLKSFYSDNNLLSSFFREEPNDGTNYIFFSLGHSLEAQSILASVIQEYAQHDFHHSYSLEALLLLLFHYLISSREYSCHGTDRHTYEVLQYLREHSLSHDCISRTARHFHYQEEALRILVKKHTGRSLESFMGESRLENALELLADPSLNIYQVVEQCGYEDAEEFFRVFRKKFHISPTEYREQFL